MDSLSLETKELMELKPREKFSIPGSSDRYTVLTRYIDHQIIARNGIVARNERTKKRHEFSGDLKIIPKTS